MTDNTFSDIVPKAVIDNVVSKYLSFSDIDLIDANIGSIISFYDTFQPDLLKSKYIKIFPELCVSGNVKCAEWLFSIMNEVYVQSNALDIFKKVCENGHLEMAVWLNYPGAQLEAYGATIKNTFLKVCKKGDLKMAQWMNQSFETAKLNVEEGEEGEGDLEIVSATFRSICENGHLEMAKWFQEYFGPYGSLSDDTFEVTCKNGHLKLAKWLKEIYTLTKEDIKISPTILAVCKKGYFEMLHWLVTSFKITSDFLNVLDRDTAFSYACTDGYYDIAKFLDEKFPVNTLIKFNYSTHPFEAVCKTGNVEFAQYLYRKFPNIVRAVVDINSTFQHLYINGFLDMAKWFDSIFNIKKDGDFNVSVFASFSTICEQGYLDFAKWFYDRFDLNANDTNYGSIFQDLCKNDYFDLAKWLYGKVNIKASDFPVIDTFIYLCNVGKIDFAYWLANAFSITLDKKVRGYNYLHKLLSERRVEHVSLVKWLANSSKFTSKNIQKINDTKYEKLGVLNAYGLDNIRENELFVYAFEKGDFVLAKFFFKEFELSHNNVFFDVEKMLHNSLKLRLDDAAFLVDLFKFDKENIDRILKNLLISFCKLGNMNVLNWLFGKFNLTKSYLSFENDILKRTAYMNNRTDVLAYLRKLQ